MHDPRPPRRRSWLPTVLLAAAVLVPLAATAVWYSGGGRGEIIATPSMGTTAPVGTLVLTRPADDIRVGDVITYRPPNPQVHHTTTHRVVSVDTTVTGQPVYTTRGDINAATDPWLLGPDDVVGRVVAIGWGLGWLVRAAPLLVAGGLLVWLLTLRTSPYWQVPLRVLGFSLVLSSVIAWLRPFVGVVSLGTGADENGSHVSLVSTGMLPIRVTAATGGHVDLVDGQVGVLTTQLPDGVEGAVLTSGVHMPWWLWVLMTLLWMTPMAWGLVSAVRHPPPEEPPRARPPRATRTARSRRRAAAVAATALAATVVLTSATPATTAAFTARVTNSATTAASNPFFTCRAAATATTPSPYLVWPLADALVTPLAPAEDASGNNRTGTYMNVFTTTTNTPCPRDPQRAVTLAPTALLPSYVATTALLPIPSTNVFSVSIWFRTTTTTGGKFMGWGNNRIGGSSTYDRHLYMTDSGQVIFGVYPGVTRTVTSPVRYNDGRWHHAVGTLSSAGLVLYVDGVAVATDPTTTTAEGGTTNTGFWRVGWDNLNPVWTSQPTTDYWTGSLAFASVYTTALTAAQVRQLYAAGA